MYLGELDYLMEKCRKGLRLSSIECAIVCRHLRGQLELEVDMVSCLLNIVVSQNREEVLCKKGEERLVFSLLGELSAFQRKVRDYRKWGIYFVDIKGDTCGRVLRLLRVLWLDQHIFEVE